MMAVSITGCKKKNAVTAKFVEDLKWDEEKKGHYVNEKKCEAFHMA